MNPEKLGLPHREPFVFVDDVLEKAPDGVRCQKTFFVEDEMFRGHFPGNPIVPGVILTEALAQAAGIAGASGGAGSKFLLSAIRRMNFPSAARPGERIELTARKAGALDGLLIFDVKATVEGRVVAEGQIVLNETMG